MDNYVACKNSPRLDRGDSNSRMRCSDEANRTCISAPDVPSSARLHDAASSILSSASEISVSRSAKRLSDQMSQNVERVGVHYARSLLLSARG